MEPMGLWKLKYVLDVVPGEGAKYITPEEMMEKPIPWVSDEEELAHERAQMKMRFDTVISVEEDGKLYALMPIPAGVTKEQLDEAVASGEVELKNGYMLMDAKDWKMEDGVAVYDTGIEGEVLGEKVSPWARLLEDDGLLTLAGMKYEKA